MRRRFVYALWALGLLSCAREKVEYDADAADSGAGVEGLRQALSSPVETPIVAVADTFIRKWDDDTNYGGLSELRAEGTTLSSDEHGLVRFDSAAITSAIGGDTFKKAELELTLNHIPGFYGDGTVSVHRMTMDWTEMGATWDCANDTATWNFWADCTLANRWGFDWGDPYPQPYVSQATDTKYVAALQTGTIRFDVTADVQQFLATPSSNHGWLIEAGRDFFIVQVHFKSRETTDKPRLLITHGACGNGVVDPGEDCDDGIACGAGSCHLGDVCTRDAACTTGSCAFGIAQQFGLPPAAGVCWNPEECATLHPPSCGAQSTMCPCCIPDCGAVGSPDGCGGTCQACVSSADSDRDGLSDCTEQNDGRTVTNPLVANAKCGNSVVDSGEACDTALSPYCAPDCVVQSSPTRCHSDFDCGYSQACGWHNGAQVGADPSLSFCWPKEPCATNPLSSCGTASSACGETCLCVPQCTGKVCGDDPSDSCGGACPGLCQHEQGNCRANSDCPFGDICGINAGPRFGLAPGENVCMAIECDDYIASRMRCGTTTDFCGVCPANPNEALGDTLCGPSCALPNFCSSEGQCLSVLALPFTESGPDGPHTPTAEVGKIPGSFEVTQNGTASYTIPIEVPPGRAGMQPSLALHYDSAAGAGFVGQGWSLTGLPAITRCAKIYATDSEASGPRGDAADAFCLGGDRLIATNGGVYGEDGTEYRTEVDTFTKVVSYGPTVVNGSIYAGPHHFMAWTKEGKILTFGNDLGARRIAGDLVVAWYVNRFEDHSGNAMSVAYEQWGLDVANAFATNERHDVAENRPVEIHYTFNGSVPSRRKVTFTYDNGSNNSLPRRFIAGAAMKISSPLQRIETYVEGQLVRTYKLATRTSGATWLLDSVTACAPSSAGEKCLPATTFQYDETGDQLSGPVGQNWVGYLHGNTPINQSPWQAAASPRGSSDRERVLSNQSVVFDFDGDGDDDLLQMVPTDDAQQRTRWTLRTSFGLEPQGAGSFMTDPVEPVVTDAQGAGSHWKDLLDCHSFQSFDFNEDGRDDLYAQCSLPTGGSAESAIYPRYVFVSDGSPTAPVFRMVTVSDSTSQLKRAALIDLDGDGRLDDVVVYGVPCGFGPCSGPTTHFGWHRNLGGQFGAFTHLGQTTDFDVADYDGDGRVDLAVLAQDGTTVTARVDAEGALALRPSAVPMPPVGHRQGVAIDVNGDGTPEGINWIEDVIPENPWLGLTLAFTNAPQSFWREGPNIISDGFIMGQIADDEHAGAFFGDIVTPPKMFVMDRDNDGRGELYLAPGVSGRPTWAEATPWDPYLGGWPGSDVASNVSFEKRGPTLPNPHNTNLEAEQRRWQEWQTPIVMDIDGDGVKDLVTRTGEEQNPYMEVSFARSRTRLRLKSIANGMGQRTGIDYDVAALPGTGTRAYAPDSGCAYPKRCIKRMPYPVVAAHTEDAGGFSRRFEYAYQGGQTDLRGRGFIGFGQRTVSELVAKTDPNTGSTWTPRSVTTYHYQLGIDDPALHMYWQAGRPDSIEDRRTLPGNLLTGGASTTHIDRTLNVWVPQTSDAGRPYFVLEATERTELEGDVTVADVTEQRVYGEYGNVTRTVSSWGSQRDLITLVDTQYEKRSDLLAKWLVALPKQIDISSSQALFEESQFKQIEIVLSDRDSRGLPFSIGRLGAGVGEPLTLRKITQLGYDDFGNPNVNADSGATESSNALPPRVTRTTYDAEGYLPILVENTVHQQLGLPGTKVHFDERNGLLEYQEGPSGDWQRFEYDGFGRVQWSANSAGQIGITSYARGEESFGPLQVTTSAVGSPTVVNEYNELGLVALRREMHEPGKETWQNFGYGNFGELRSRGVVHFKGTQSPGAAQFTYDDLGRLIEEDYPYEQSLGSPATGSVLHMRANRTLASANLSSDTSSKLGAASATRVHLIEFTGTGDMTLQALDARNNVRTALDVGGTAAYYDYGGFDHLRSITFEGAFTSITSNELGLTTHYDDPNRGAYDYKRNGFGEVEQLTRDLGGSDEEVTTYVFDGLGRRTSSTTPDGVYHWHWDGDGTEPSLAGRLDSDSIDTTSTSYAYDGAGGALSLVHRTVGGEPFDTQFTYGASGLLEKVTYPESFPVEIKYAYNALGQPTKVFDPTDEAHPFWSLDAANGLDAFGGVAKGAYRNGVQSTQVREASTGLLKSTLAQKGNTVLLQESYGYDARGRLLLRQSPSDIETFGYDALGRLAGHSSAFTGESVAFGYDPHRPGNLTESPTVGTLTYGVTGGPDTVSSTTDGRSFEYDHHGNQWQRQLEDGTGTSTQTITYTAFDLPKEIQDTPSTGSPEHTQFTYDASGQRVVQAIDGGDTTTYAGDLYRRVTHAEGPVEKTAVVPLPDGTTLEIVQAGGALEYHYSHVDHQGSVRAVSDGSGVLLESRSYSPFGKPNQSSWATHVTAGYTGHEHDSRQGLINMRGRMYDPDIGRFLTPDPVMQAPFRTQGLNAYSYVFNDPMNFVDPSGFTCSGQEGPGTTNCVDDNGQSYVVDVDQTGATFKLDGPDIGGAAERVNDPFGPNGISPNQGDNGLSEVAGALVAEPGTPQRTDLQWGSSFQPSLLTEVSNQPQFQDWEEYGRELVFAPYDIAQAALDAPGALVFGGIKIVGEETVEYVAREAAESAASRAGGAAAVRVGQAGEAAVRGVADIGEKALIRVAGRARIPDGLTSTVLSEVKNVGSLSYTQQLRDFAAHASANGLRFDLWVRPTTQLSGPLAQEVANGAINLRYIP